MPASTSSLASTTFAAAAQPIVVSIRRHTAGRRSNGVPDALPSWSESVRPSSHAASSLEIAAHR